MPRNYKSKLSVRRYGFCDNSRLQEALDRVAAGSGANLGWSLGGIICNFTLIFLYFQH